MSTLFHPADEGLIQFKSVRKRLRVLEFSLKEPSLSSLEGKIAARRAVLLDGIEDDAKDSPSSDSTWLGPSS